MLWVRHQSKKGQQGGSLRLPEYAYVVRISEANLCDIGTSCNTVYNNFEHTVFLIMIMSDYSLKYFCWILPLPRAVEKPKQKGKKKMGRVVRHRLI